MSTKLSKFGGAGLHTMTASRHYDKRKEVSSEASFWLVHWSDATHLQIRNLYEQGPGSMDLSKHNRRLTKSFPNFYMIQSVTRHGARITKRYHMAQRYACIVLM
jgi:hypothetical protein